MCACGCGKPVNSRRATWIRGHHRCGAKNTAAHNKRLAEGRAEAIASGRMTRVGRPRKLRPLCACGCGKRVPKMNQTYLNRKHRDYSEVCASPERMRAMAALRDPERMRKISAQNMRRTVASMKCDGRWERMMADLKMTRGLPDHRAAKTWSVRDPRGRVYAFSNLAEWARRNESLFPDPFPRSKHPNWYRVADGIRGLASKRYSQSYRGWVLVSVGELADGGGDLIRRESDD